MWSRKGSHDASAPYRRVTDVMEGDVGHFGRIGRS